MFEHLDFDGIANFVTAYKHRPVEFAVTFTIHDQRHISIGKPGRHTGLKRQQPNRAINRHGGPASQILHAREARKYRPQDGHSVAATAVWMDDAAIARQVTPVSGKPQRALG